MTDTLGVACDTVGDGEGKLPGSGLLASPDGSGFLCCLKSMLSLSEPELDSLGRLDGNAVRPDDAGANERPRITARRLGLEVLSVTIRRFLGIPFS